MSMSVTIKDFYPINEWKPHEAGPKDCLNIPKYIIDNSTGRYYLNSPKNWTRVKFILMIPISPLTHMAGVIGNVFYRIIKILCFIPLLRNIYSVKNWSLSDVFAETGKDLLRIIASIPVFFGLQISVFLGMVSPNNGKKVYATIERAYYGDFLLAPNFQPVAPEAVKA